jgi:hypothetical protein
MHTTHTTASTAAVIVSVHAQSRRVRFIGAAYHETPGYAAPMHRPTRQPRLHRFRRAARRVVMWTALVAAIGIGVVWAGGKRAIFPRGLVGGTGVNVYGLKGGVLITNDEFVDGITFVSGPIPYLQRNFTPVWKPSWSTHALSWELQLPYWIPTLLCLTTFALLFRIERHDKRRTRVSTCAACEYDLAGLPTAAVCPECGATRQ